MELCNFYFKNALKYLMVQIMISVCKVHFLFLGAKLYQCIDIYTNIK